MACAGVVDARYAVEDAARVSSRARQTLRAVCSSCPQNRQQARLHLQFDYLEQSSVGSLQTDNIDQRLEAIRDRDNFMEFMNPKCLRAAKLTLVLPVSEEAQA